MQHRLMMEGRTFPPKIDGFASTRIRNALAVQPVAAVVAVVAVVAAEEADQVVVLSKHGKSRRRQ